MSIERKCRSAMLIQTPDEVAQLMVRKAMESIRTREKRSENDEDKVEDEDGDDDDDEVEGRIYKE